MVSPLENVIAFLESFGFFNVVLPFLLVFTIVFGILEKTKIFGVDKVGGKEVPKKNLNAMVAFAIAFFVVTASNVVQAIRATIPSIVLVLIFIIAFLILAGTLVGDEQFKLTEKYPALSKVFIAAIIILIVLIVLNAFGLLSKAIGLAFGGTSGGLLSSSLIFLAIIIGAIIYVVGGGKKKEKE